MFGQVFPTLKQSIKRTKNHSQFFWTVLVAISIVVAFFIVSQLFISIAEDAQEQLINARISSIQDSLSEFVVLEDGSKVKVENTISNLMNQNKAILNFTFYTKDKDIFRVFASSDKAKVGTTIENIPLIAQLALNDPKNSYTTEVQKTNKRSFHTFRSLTQNGQIVGLIETTQTLSDTDLVIEKNIRSGIMISVFILLLLLFLFFTYSRITDYILLYTELRKVDQLKDDFISMISHELKTPLAAIRGYSEFITDAPDIADEYKEYSRRIDISSKQLTFFVENMLEVHKIQQGKIQFDDKKILVPDFIKKLMPDFDALIENKNITFSFKQEGLKFAYIIADEILLKQVFINLVDNAVKYSKQGEVQIMLSNLGEKLEIRISDKGIGVNKEEQKHLFEKFYRVKNVGSQKIKGSGLGLWIAKQLTEKMNGTLSVESVKGIGTNMIILFDAHI